MAHSARQLAHFLLATLATAKRDPMGGAGGMNSLGTAGMAGEINLEMPNNY